MAPTSRHRPAATASASSRAKSAGTIRTRARPIPTPSSTARATARRRSSYIGHTLAENQHGLVVEANATKATSRAEREAALLLIERHDPGSERRLTLGADKGYDTAGFVAECRRMCVTPHVASKVKHSALDGRTTRHAAYATSQRKRKLIEEAFGWAKTIAGVAKVKVRGLARVRHCFTLAMTAYNLIRMPKLLGWAAA